MCLLEENLEVDVYSPEYTLKWLVELKYYTQSEVDKLLEKYSKECVVGMLYKDLFPDN